MGDEMICAAVKAAGAPDGAGRGSDPILCKDGKRKTAGALHNNSDQKDLTGEFDDRIFMATRGDTRLSMTLSRTPETLKFNRQSRFIIDDPASQEQLAYALSKPLRMGMTYNDNGVFKFVMQEVVTTDDDNLELRIADYYKHFPRDYTVDANVGDIPATGTTDTRNGRKNWL